MSEKSNPTRGEPLESKTSESQAGGSDSIAANEYQVGPGCPPPDKRWKKGCRSPNPRGRPRKKQSMLPDVRKAFEQAANKKVPVTRGDRKVLMTRVEMGLEQLFNQFAKGDRYARRDLMEYADKLGIDFLAKHKQALEEAIAPKHQAILDAYVAHRGGAGNVAPATPVLATPDLLDDDSTEAEPTSASPPKPETKPKISLPAPIPGKKPPERMGWTELRAFYPEWWAQNGEAWAKQRLGR